VEQPTPMIAQLRATFEAMSPEAYAASCAAVRDADLRRALHRIHAPTLVIAGTEDRVTSPEDARHIADEVRGSRYMALPASHLSNIQAAPAFADAVVHFLTGRH
jgi:3-oxoadipate enol-lactonase